MTSEDQPEAPIAIPITGELDLHTFQPRELDDVLSAYFEACRERKIFSVRVVHGKGTGTLRTSVHAWLRRRRDVESFHQADAADGGWGATWVRLHS